MTVPAETLDPRTCAFYRRALTALTEAGVPFLVGGAYAFARITGIERHTKDLDIFLRPADRDLALRLLASQDCQTEVAFPHWLAKAHCGEDYIDIIYSSGNGVTAVDDEWFAHATADTVLGVPVLLCPTEEMIWSKAFVQERERFDGADIAHLLHANGRTLDWPRLLRRFSCHWRVLLAHLLLFGFVYPSERDAVPAWLLRSLWRRAEQELAAGPLTQRICQGPLLSRAQYLHDIDQLGYVDARLTAATGMTREDVARWTAAIAEERERHDSDDTDAAAGCRC